MDLLWSLQLRKDKVDDLKQRVQEIMKELGASLGQQETVENVLVLANKTFDDIMDI